MGMITFVIKSAICLIILYGFYHLFLRNVKVFDFNRYYLLFSLIFAIATPLITIRFSLNLPINPNVQEFSNVAGSLIQADKITVEPIHYFTVQNVVVFLYLIVTFILLLRFTFNIYKIIQQIRAGSIINSNKTHIVLIENKTLPYSFFKYIFVNRSDYENGKIEKELIIHEQVHCLQYHSVDILIIELVKIVLWFNPLLWLFQKAIKLNHEFLADNKVLSTHSLNDYQNTLINLVFRNNSTYLASNFNYSLTKKRLIMMTKNKSKYVGYKIAMVPILAALVFYFISCSKESENVNTYKNSNETWWNPILKKHNIEPEGFNNFENVFEMGAENSINNKIVTLKDAVFIIKPNSGGYIILKSPLAYHNLNTNRIEGEKGSIEIYKDLQDSKPYKAFSLINFKYQLRNEKNQYDSWDAREVNFEQ